MTAPKVAELPIDQVDPNPHNPRADLGQLDDLTASIRRLGVLQPIVVVPDGSDRWIVVAGSRRLHAARAAGETTIAAVIRDMDPLTREEAAIAENVVRLQMSPVEEALVYARVMKERKLSQRDVARLIGTYEARVSKRLALLNLPKETLQMVHDGAMTVSQALDEERAQRAPSPKARAEGRKSTHVLDGHRTCSPRACEVRQIMNQLDIQ